MHPKSFTAVTVGHYLTPHTGITSKSRVHEQARSRLLPLVLVGVLAGMFLPPRALLAHDDGLTCHEHPSSGGFDNDLLIVNNGDGADFLESGTLGHVIRNLATEMIDAGVADFTRSDVITLLSGLREFEEMVQTVHLLVVQGERASDTNETLTLARIVFDRLPISEFVNFEVFLKDRRIASATVVPLRAVVRFLRSGGGVPASLLAVARGAHQSC